MNRLKWTIGGVFLAFGLTLLGFAIGGLFGWLPEGGEVITDINVGSIELPEHAKQVTFAAGCFWCTEASFQEEKGVLDAVSGYAGGTTPDPSYNQVARGRTDYREGIQAWYDPEVTSYERMLEVFWNSIDPTDVEGQFTDKGFQYTTAIFYHDDEQKRLAEESLVMVQKLYDESVATKILPYTSFYVAEEYHQDFYKNSKRRYEQYTRGSGREAFEVERNLDSRLLNLEDEGVSYGAESKYGAGAQEDEELSQSNHNSTNSLGQKDGWSAENFQEPSDEQLKEILTSTQYRVTQKDGTEIPFSNAYWDNKQEGIYVDIVSGEPLYSSADKYKSGTGRPSFTQPIGGDVSVVTLHDDQKLFAVRTEVRSAIADSHLGHVFDDGPVERGGKRYCMNSASMDFVPYDEMKDEGYGEWMEYVR